jgi:glycerophosphoryl diester phosphodiesterase
MKKLLTYVIVALAGFAAFAWLNNTSLFSRSEVGSPVLLAHRGLHQTFSREGLEGDTCTASRIYPPEHAFIENTLASMRAAFAAGADIVELDIHPTTDGEFAVFHDWTLDCRTDGKGVTRERAMADLKALDVGYGYTADGGRTFPLRGTGIGLMPTLTEVLTAFPGKRFLINVKSNDAREGEKLAAYLAALSPEARSRLMAYGGTAPVELVHAKLADVAVGSARSLKSCLVRYILLGWAGHVPEACRAGMMLVPLNVAPWLWGWPHKFMQRMHAAGVQVFVLGPYDGSFGSSGVDDLNQLAKLPKPFSGGIWTNRIDRIGAALRRDPSAQPR